jgi:transcription elongation factor GreA
VSTIAPSPTASVRDALAARLAELKSLRDQAELDAVPQSTSGDAADRAENVEALIRLEDLESRIAKLELQLQSADLDRAKDRSAGVVEIGSVVQISFSADEPDESFVIGPVEQAAGGVDVITPASPLGTALLGSKPGQTVSYRAANGRTLSVTLTGIS